MTQEGEPFEISSQGCILRGFILRPKKEGKLPAAIISHGFSGNTEETKKYADIFVENGYVAFCYDFCMSGSGKSTGSSLGMSVLTEKQDLLNLLNYVKTFDYVDKDKISLVGCSQGGFVSALAAVECEKDIRNIILLYPALCIPDDANRGNMAGAKFDPKNIPEQLQCGPITLSKKYPLDAMKIDYIKDLCPFKKPVLIIPAVNDGLVNISYARNLAKAYPNCKLVECPGDHGFYTGEGLAECKQAIADYIKQ